MRTCDANPEIERAVRVLGEGRDATGDRLSDVQRHALAVLYGHYFALAVRVARRYSASAAEAEDVAHDVFLELHRSLAGYRPGNFGGWLSLVVKRAAQMRARRLARECPFAEEAEQRLDGLALADESTAASEMDVTAALGELPDALRRLIVLRVYEDYSHKEIAAALGISVAASEVRLCRAFKRLRATFSEACVA